MSHIKKVQNKMMNLENKISFFFGQNAIEYMEGNNKKKIKLLDNPHLVNECIHLYNKLLKAEVVISQSIIQGNNERFENALLPYLNIGRS